MKKIGIILFILITTRLQGQESKEISYGWLAGSSTGDGFGGVSEEIWSHPSDDGTMMGVYRHHKGDGSLNFYEFMVLDETGLRLKHFNASLVGWETKENFVTFEMIEYSENKIVLKGLVFEKLDDYSIEIRLNLKNNEKEWRKSLK